MFGLPTASCFLLRLAYFLLKQTTIHVDPTTYRQLIRFK
jgi:hypothetical protein